MLSVILLFNLLLLIAPFEAAPNHNAYFSAIPVGVHLQAFKLFIILDNEDFAFLPIYLYCFTVPLLLPSPC
jgi:hypothetical protein